MAAKKLSKKLQEENGKFEVGTEVVVCYDNDGVVCKKGAINEKLTLGTFTGRPTIYFVELETSGRRICVAENQIVAIEQLISSTQDIRLSETIDYRNLEIRFNDLLCEMEGQNYDTRRACCLEMYAAFANYTRKYGLNQANPDHMNTLLEMLQKAQSQVQ